MRNTVVALSFSHLAMWTILCGKRHSGECNTEQTWTRAWNPNANPNDALQMVIEGIVESDKRLNQIDQLFDNLVNCNTHSQPNAKSYVLLLRANIKCINDQSLSNEKRMNLILIRLTGQTNARWWYRTKMAIVQYSRLRIAPSPLAIDKVIVRLLVYLRVRIVVLRRLLCMDQETMGYKTWSNLSMHKLTNQDKGN